MSSDIEKARRALDRRLKEASSGVFYSTVVSVDEKTRTCCVSGDYGLFEGVSLYAVEDKGKKGWCLFPKVNSTVLVGRIGGTNDLFVAMFSEVDRVVFSCGATSAVIDGSGFSFNRDGGGLRDTLVRLCDAIMALTVPTSVGPSGTPINMDTFMQIKTDLDKYLKNA